MTTEPALITTSVNSGEPVTRTAKIKLAALNVPVKMATHCSLIDILAKSHLLVSIVFISLSCIVNSIVDLLICFSSINTALLLA